MAQRRNSLHEKVALRRFRLEVDLKKFPREILVQRGKRRGEVARLRVAHDRRLVAIDLDMGDRDQASPLRRGQRMMARREEYGLPAQDDSGGQIGHRRVPGIDEAQIVVAVPRPEDERRHVDGHPDTSRYILIADQENQ